MFQRVNFLRNFRTQNFTYVRYRLGKAIENIKSCTETGLNVLNMSMPLGKLIVLSTALNERHFRLNCFQILLYYVTCKIFRTLLMRTWVQVSCDLRGKAVISCMGRNMIYFFRTCCVIYLPLLDIKHCVLLNIIKNVPNASHPTVI